MDALTSGTALLRLGARLYRLQVEALEGLRTPLTVRQYRILERVDAGVTSPGELADRARRRPPTISRSVDSLVRQGLLDRRPSQVDRRSVSLALTPEGRDLLFEARKTLEELSRWLGTMMGLDVPRLAERCDSLYAKTEVLLRTEAPARAGGGRPVAEAGSS